MNNDQCCSKNNGSGSFRRRNVISLPLYFYTQRKTACDPKLDFGDRNNRAIQKSKLHNHKRHTLENSISIKLSESGNVPGQSSSKDGILVFQHIILKFWVILFLCQAVHRSC